jgi:hypothetical protein
MTFSSLFRRRVLCRPKPWGHELLVCNRFSQDITRYHNSDQFRPALNLNAALQTHTSRFRHRPLALNILPHWRSHSIITRKLMPTLSQGASGPSTHAGLRAALGQPAVSGNHPAPQQISSEQPISREIRRLIVRLLIDFFDLRANKLSDGSRTLSKNYGRSMRYDSVSLTRCCPNRSEGVACDKGRV